MFIETFTGKKINPLEPTINDICIEDISHSLNNICRYTGHSNIFYTVAQHSIFVADLLRQEHSKQIQLAGLLHDAAEAYIGDISRPLKSALNKFYPIEDIERRILSIIYRKFDVPQICIDSPYIKAMDDMALAIEKEFLFPDSIIDWELEMKPTSEGIELFQSYFNPFVNHFSFLETFENLEGK